MKKSIYQIIKETFFELNADWNTYMTISLLQIASSVVFVFILPPFGFILAFFVCGITMAGLSRFLIKKLSDKQAQYEDVFYFRKHFFTIATTQAVKTLHIFFWSIFMIVPGIITAIDYSMSCHLVAQNPKEDSYDILQKSKQLTQGHEGKIFMLWILYALLTILMILFASSLILLTKMITPVSSYIAITSLVVITSILFLFVVLPFINVSKTILYENLKDIYDKKIKLTQSTKPKVTKTVKSTNVKPKKTKKTAKDS